MLSASAELGAEASVSASERVEVTAMLQLIEVTQSMTPEGDYRWSLKPSKGTTLTGRPWDAESTPRLKIVDLRKDRSKGLPPAVRVEVRCRREDLEIKYIEIKSKNTWEAVKNRAGFRNRLAAAEAYIRDRLTKEGLAIKNFSDAFGEVTVASTTAEPQG
jgi:hypothetical protein